jgi:outer membrane lipoprotein-sorting protein
MAHPIGMGSRLARAVVCVACFASSLAAQNGGGLDDAFARLDKAAQQFKSVTADIKRNVHTAVINDDARDQGSIRVRHDKGHDTKMLIDFTGAEAKTVSLDGADVSVYYPKLNTVQIYDVGSKRNLVDQFLLLGFGASSSQLKDNYNITYAGMEMIGSDNTWHLQLVPKSADALKNLKRAELWISPNSGLPMQQKFTTSGTGDFTLVTYSNMKPNAPVSDKDLKLSYPKGVKVEHPRL